MPTLTRPDGVDLYYETHGDPSLPVLLLSHGFSATSQMWRGQIESLAPRVHLVLWDLRGHGRSSSPEDLERSGEEQTVDDMAALLDELGADSAIVGGLSLGGYMSLAFHARYPQRVRALLVFDTGPGYKNPDAREKWNQSAEATARKLEEEGLAWLRARSAERSGAQHRSAAGLVCAARRMLTQRDDRVIRSLPRIEVPTLVLVGADDEPFLAASSYMAAKIPRAEHVVLDGAGHAANLDRPEAFDRAVVEFLERHELVDIARGAEVHAARHRGSK